MWVFRSSARVATCRRESTPVTLREVVERLGVATAAKKEDQL
jgi:transcription initiation factor TFIIIB Brf1 subunit/transcription initiation factor TFIIB